MEERYKNVEEVRQELANILETISRASKRVSEFVEEVAVVIPQLPAGKTWEGVTRELDTKNLNSLTSFG